MGCKEKMAAGCGDEGCFFMSYVLCSIYLIKPLIVFGLNELFFFKIALLNSEYRIPSGLFAKVSRAICLICFVMDVFFAMFYFVVCLTYNCT
jgi:hypothetical protein